MIATAIGVLVIVLAGGACLLAGLIATHEACRAEPFDGVWWWRN